jgi:toxin YoeB
MVRRKIIWSPRAKHDLFAILDFYFQRNGSITYSKKLNFSIRKSIRLLEKQPEIGRRTDITDIRNLTEGDYNIFYEIKSITIEIVTVWDNRQNPGRLIINV